MRREIAKGAALMLLFRLVDRSLGLVSTAALARLLLPADFGIVAMAMSIVALIELATAFSFEIALIQKDKPEPMHYDTAWTLNILLACAGAALTVVLAHPAAEFYAEPRLTAVMYAIAAFWLVSGFENIGTVNFRRSMNFGREFRFLAFKRAIGFVVVVSAAFLLRSYWALVIGTAASRIVGVALSYALEPYRPRLSLAASRELFHFSGWMLAGNIAHVTFSRVPQFFVGRMLGARELGTYTVGAEIAQLAHTELVAPINRAMIPGYSRLAGKTDEFRRIFIESAAGVLLIVLPATVGIAAIAGPLVRVLLGEQWAAAVPVIQVLAFAGAVSAIISNNNAAYVALGRPYLPVVTSLVRVVVLVPLLFLLSGPAGMLGVVTADFISAAASLAVSYPILFSQLKIPVRNYLAALWRPLLGSAVMGFIVYRLNAGAAPTELTFSAGINVLVVGVVAGAMTYVCMLWILWLLSGRPDAVEVAFVRFLANRGKEALRR